MADVDAAEQPVPEAAPVDIDAEAGMAARPTAAHTTCALVLMLVGMSGAGERLVHAAGWSNGVAIAWYAAIAMMGAVIMCLCKK